MRRSGLDRRGRSPAGHEPPAAAAAERPASRVGSAAKAETLSVGFVAEPANLDFTSTEGAAIPQALLVNVYEGLVKLDQDGKIQPLLAEKWEVSDDRKTYTFTLRKGVTFTNGAPFTADDVVFSLDRVKSDWKLKIKSQLDVVKDVEKKDDSTVVVTLKRPEQRLPLHHGHPARRDVQPHRRRRPGQQARRHRPVQARLVAARRLHPARRPTRPTGARSRRCPAVTLKYFKDATAMNNALLTGGIDVISSVQAPESLQQFADPNRFETVEGTTNGEVVLSMNNGRPPFNDKKVRQAVRYAIDHKALLDTAWAGRGQLIGSMVPPTDPWYEDRTGDYPYDVGQGQGTARRQDVHRQDAHPQPALRGGRARRWSSRSSPRWASRPTSSRWSSRPAGWTWCSPRATTTCRSSTTSSPAT